MATKNPILATSNKVIFKHHPNQNQFLDLFINKENYITYCCIKPDENKDLVTEIFTKRSFIDWGCDARYFESFSQF